MHIDLLKKTKDENRSLNDQKTNKYLRYLLIEFGDCGKVNIL